MIFPLTSTKITVSEMDLSQQGPFAGYKHSMGGCWSSYFCVSAPRAFFSHKQKEKRGAQGQVGSSNPPVRPSKLFFQFFL